MAHYSRTYGPSAGPLSITRGIEPWTYRRAKIERAKCFDCADRGLTITFAVAEMTRLQRSGPLYCNEHANDRMKKERTEGTL